MRLDHSFVVPVPAPRAWAALLDERPGLPLLSEVAIDTHGDDRFAGTLRVKVGPMTLCYRGSGHYVVKDPSSLRLMIEAAGQDVHGGGTAAATVVTTLRENPDRTTRIELCTELVVTGRLMQDNRRLVQAAGARLVAHFADGLRARVEAEGGAPGVSGPDRAAPPRRLRGLVPYLCAFLLGGLLTLAVVVVLG
jgi:carbon monoxide dehydrogenase subunit G